MHHHKDLLQKRNLYRGQMCISVLSRAKHQQLEEVSWDPGLEAPAIWIAQSPHLLRPLDGGLAVAGLDPYCQQLPILGSAVTQPSQLQQVVT